MSQQLGEQVLNHVDGWMNGLGHVIQELAKSLGVAAEHVYTVYTKQVFAEGLTDLIINGFIFLTFICLYIITWHFTKEINNSDKWGTRLLGFVILCFVSLFLISNIRDGLLQILNPEYYTIQKLVDMVHSISK